MFRHTEKLNFQQAQCLDSISVFVFLVFTMLTNVKMSTIVGILIFISMINSISENLKANSLYFSALEFL